MDYCTEIDCDDAGFKIAGCHETRDFFQPSCKHCRRLFPAACAPRVSCLCSFLLSDHSLSPPVSTAAPPFLSLNLSLFSRPCPNARLRPYVRIALHMLLLLLHVPLALPPPAVAVSSRLPLSSPPLPLRLDPLPASPYLPSLTCRPRPLYSTSSHCMLPPASVHETHLHAL